VASKRRHKFVRPYCRDEREHANRVREAVLQNWEGQPAIDRAKADRAKERRELDQNLRAHDEHMRVTGWLGAKKKIRRAVTKTHS
jgi:hypothetical protein